MSKERVIVIEVEGPLHLVSDKRDTGDIAGKVRDVLSEAAKGPSKEEQDFTDLEAWAFTPDQTATRAVKAGKVSVGEMMLYLQLKSLTRVMSAINRNFFEIGKAMNIIHPGSSLGSTEKSGQQEDV